MRYLAKLASPLIQPLLQQKQDIENIIQKVIDETISGCKHPKESIRELPSADTGYGYQFPFLICTDCGLAEEGWGCGYKNLKHGEYSSQKIDSKVFNSIVTKTVLQGRHLDEDYVEHLAAKLLSTNLE